MPSIASLPLPRTLRRSVATPPAPRALAEADLAACRAQLADGSRTFLAASRLLPGAVRDPACALYAFCRSADDAVDLEERDELAAVERLRARLARLYRGDPENSPADRAMARTVAHFEIPRVLPEALLEGFEWDARGRRYETLEDLYDYAARVAGTVGAMMAVLMGTRSPQALARACDLGVAMQLSNIARDVGEDARMGRIYLPLQWLREVGIDPETWLARPVFDERLASVVRRLLHAADALYARVDAGIALLPATCRPGIQAARVLYAAIGHEVARRGCDSVTQRAVVPRGRKAALLAGALALGATRWRRTGRSEPPLEAVRYLVEAAAWSAPSEPAAAASDRRASPDVPPDMAAIERAVWVIELCERQAHRRQMRRSGLSSHSSMGMSS
jgi:phytoene synthase